MHTWPPRGAWWMALSIRFLASTNTADTSASARSCPDWSFTSTVTVRCSARRGSRLSDLGWPRYHALAHSRAPGPLRRRGGGPGVAKGRELDLPGRAPIRFPSIEAHGFDQHGSGSLSWWVTSLPQRRPPRMATASRRFPGWYRRRVGGFSTRETRCGTVTGGGSVACWALRHGVLPTGQGGAGSRHRRLVSAAGGVGGVAVKICSNVDAPS